MKHFSTFSKVGTRVQRWLIETITILLITSLAFAASAQVKSSSANDAEAPNQSYVYAAAALLSVNSEPAFNVLLTIHNGKISRVQDGVVRASLPGNLRLIDLSCCFLMPGLIDTQTHLTSQPGLPSHSVRLTQWSDARLALLAMENAKRTVQAGFTTIRDMGHSGDAVFAVRDAINNNIIAGPRVQVAGEILRPTGGDLRAWLRPVVEARLRVPAICDGPEDCRRAVRASVAVGADTIKVASKADLGSDSPSQFNLAELVAIREAAHRLGVKVTASAFSTDSINLPLEAGFDGVVHGTYANADTFKRLRRSGAWFIPTLLAARVVREIAEDPKASVSAAWREENLAIYHGMVASFQQALAASAPMAFGTDAGWRPHGENAEQLEQMVSLGMTPKQALASATVNAALAMGWEDRVGTLQVGRFADIIALHGNPLEDITLVRQPLVVLKGGSVVADYREE